MSIYKNIYNLYITYTNIYITLKYYLKKLKKQNNYAIMFTYDNKYICLKNNWEHAIILSYCQH